MSEGAEVTLDTAVLADLAAKARGKAWRNPDAVAFRDAMTPAKAAALLAEVESLRMALTGLLNQYTDDTGNFHDACDERECAVARAALVSEEGSRTR